MAVLNSATTAQPSYRGLVSSMRSIYYSWEMRLLAVSMLIVNVAAATVATAQTGEPPTILDHPKDARIFVGGQINIIFQRHGDFPALYSGPHSFQPVGEETVSRVWTVYTGAQLGRGWEVLVDVEAAGGRGLSDAFGLAGFTDLDVVRNPSLGGAPYLARAMVHKTIALSSETTAASRTPLALAARVPARRLEIRAGKLGTVDFFDANAVGGDSHLQFTNWTIDNNGAYDYAADTRGYTYGAIVEFASPHWSLRGAEALMPTVANGIVLDWKLRRARGENVEFEWRPVSPLVLRILGYANHANMGSYSEAISSFVRGADVVPDIESHRQQGRVKAGAGANFEYSSTAGVRLFGRAGANGGDTESFAYTEVNNTTAGGFDLSGQHWRRDGDRLGVAIVSNGLSAAHREYLRLGGLGFLLGDGNLTYGREDIVETYYTAHVWRGVFASAGLQYIVHPGYNRDRGPVFVQMVRAHVDF
jgi:hypothetical protein